MHLCQQQSIVFFKWFIIISFMNFSLALKELYIQVALVIYMCVFYKVFFPCLLREFLYRNSVSRFFTNQEIPGILWNLKVITMFIRAQLWFLSRATLIQLTPCRPVSCRCILISFSNRCLHLPSGLLLIVSLRKSLVCVYLHHVYYMPHQSHSVWFDHPNNIW